jgi:hypothetical protein
MKFIYGENFSDDNVNDIYFQVFCCVKFALKKGINFYADFTHVIEFIERNIIDFSSKKVSVNWDENGMKKEFLHA